MRLLVLPFLRLCAQLATVLLFYSVFRLSFILFNLSSFPDLDAKMVLGLLIRGIRFDVSAILVLNSLFIFLLALPFKVNRKLVKFSFVVPNALGFLFEIADWMYFPYNHKRATAEILDLIGRKGDFLVLLPTFLKDYWFLFVLAFCFLALLVWSYRKIEMHFRKRERLLVLVDGLKLPSRPAFTWGIRLSIFVVVIGLSIIGIRGGLQYIPINIRNAVEATNTEYAPIVLNTPFSIINSVANAHLELKNYMSEEEAWALASPIKEYPAEDSFRRKNVVIIILESFSKEFTQLGPGKSYTPFLDSLMDQGMSFSNAFANGLHSAEGLPAIIAAIPSLMSEAFSVSAYSANRISALPSLLKEKGYTSAFFHGATNGSMSFDVFSKSAGFERYYGRTEYGNEADYDGSWGIFDEPFLQFAAERMGQQKQPFVNTIFTVTSHTPYPLPKEYKGKFPDDGLPVRATISYTDLALRRFFERVSKEDWYGNTLFVLTADHCSPMASSNYYSSGLGRYQIPIVFFAPGDTLSLRGNNHKLMQQIDIMPSILDYLNYGAPFFSFGNSIFKDKDPFVINKLNETYFWIHSGYMMNIFDEQIQGAYAFPSDSTQSENLIRHNHFPEGKSSFRLWKAFVQIYNEALVKNKMTMESQ